MFISYLSTVARMSHHAADVAFLGLVLAVAVSLLGKLARVVSIRPPKTLRVVLAVIVAMPSTYVWVSCLIVSGPGTIASRLVEWWRYDELYVLIFLSAPVITRESAIAIWEMLSKPATNVLNPIGVPTPAEFNPVLPRQRRGEFDTPYPVNNSLPYNGGGRS